MSRLEVPVGVAESVDGTTPRRLVVARPSPDFLVTLVLALTVPLFWVVAAVLPLVLLVPLAAAVSVPLAAVDARRAEQVFGRRLAHPLLAAPTPILYLLVRNLRDLDLRAGRAMWVALAVGLVVLFFRFVAAAGGYAMAVHGF